MKKLVVLLNPVSGRGQGTKLAPKIEQMLHASSLDFDLLLSERPWHTAEMAERAAREGCEILVSAGGDGTANEAINGLMRARTDGHTRTALGLVSIGTGNDFAASLGMPAGLQEAVDVIIKGKRRLVDVGLLRGCDFPDGRYFGNCVGIGFDAAGTILSYKLTWVKGLLAYLIAAMGTIFFYYKAPILKIDLDNESVSLPSLLVSIMNGRRIGGGFWTAPDAKQDDGLFDLCIARQVSRPRMFTLIPHFLKGTQASQPEISMKQTRSVTIKALKGSMPVQMDGEIIGETCGKLAVEILPQQLEIIGI